VTNKTLPSATNYLACREAYQVEYHRYCRLESMLKEALGASDAGDFERKMLEARSQKRHPAFSLIALYNEQGVASSTRQQASSTPLKICRSAKWLLLKLKLKCKKISLLLNVNYHHFFYCPPSNEKAH
jgi:hypothetical protein